LAASAQTRWDLVVVGVTALLAASIPLLLPNGSFNGYGFNGAVYLSSSIHLVHGVMPYRDFVLIQPPGIALLLSPLSLLSLAIGSHAIWGIARLVVIVVTALNCLLVALLLRRFGPAATLSGGLFLAAFSVAGLVDTQVKLEPFLVAFVLLSALAMFEETNLAVGRRATIAGALLGFAGAIKLWAILPAVVMVVIVLWKGRASIGRFSIGLILGFGIPIAPFFVASPENFIHDVFLTQMRRAPSTGQAPGVLHRLATLSFDAFRPFTPNLGVAGLLGAVVAVAATISLLRRRRSLTAIESFAAASSAISIAALLLAPEYLAYYAYFPAAFFALIVGSTVAAELECFRRWVDHGSRDRARAISWIAAGVLVALCAAFFVAQASSTRIALASLRAPGPSTLISSMVPTGACVVSNDAYATLMADRLNSNRSGCPTVVDAEGLWLSIAPASPPPLGRSVVPRVTEAWRSIFAASDYVVLNRQGDAYVAWTPQLRQWFARRFMLVGSNQDLAVYRSFSLPTGQ
jgi:hypothetical protein